MKMILTASVVILLSLGVLGGDAARSADGASLDTVFMTIDRADISLAGGTRAAFGRSEAAAMNLGIGPSPFILWRTSLQDYRGWIFTLNSETGAQMGNRLEVAIPAFETPADAIWSRYFFGGIARGVGPSPFIICRNYILRVYHVLHGSDGTPEETASPDEYFLPIDPAVYGYATCLAEIPGTEFIDGNARLFIGSDQGYIAMLIMPTGASIVVDGIFSVSTMPIVDLEPIPQYGTIALGALSDGVIQGIRFGHNGPGVAFSLADPRIVKPLDFDVFGAQDVPLADPDGTVRLILANGSSELALASMAAEQSGQQNLDLTLDQRNEDIAAVAPGSLLMLLADGSGVLYDPIYSSDTGSSRCDVDVTDTISDVCGYLCGDANGDRTVNIGDAVFVINFIFKGGPAPAPLQAGDANCDGARNVGDAVYVINYIFKGGPAPCCP